MSESSPTRSRSRSAAPTSFATIADPGASVAPIERDVNLSDDILRVLDHQGRSSQRNRDGGRRAPADPAARRAQSLGPSLRRRSPRRDDRGPREGGRRSSATRRGPTAAARRRPAPRRDSRRRPPRVRSGDRCSPCSGLDLARSPVGTDLQCIRQRLRNLGHSNEASRWPASTKSF